LFSAILFQCGEKTCYCRIIFVIPKNGKVFWKVEKPPKVPAENVGELFELEV